MIRIIHYPITSSEMSGALTVKGFLRSKGYSVQNLKILKQNPEGLLCNGLPIRANACLMPESTLTVKITESASSENIVPVNLPIDVVYEDEDLMVVNKPAGMPTHPSQNNRDNTLANALAYYFYEKGEPFVFRCIGRLDRDTSGLTVIAKHFVSAGILGALLSKKGWDSLSFAGSDPWSRSLQAYTREYLAIIRGTLTPAAGTISAPLGRKPGSIIERCVEYENGEPAITHYKVMTEKNGYSLVSLILETGRTHQIRIHLKHLGHPLIGDYLYNPDFEKISRQALHAHRLSFPHPMTGEQMEFSAPMPEDMRLLFP